MRSQFQSNDDGVSTVVAATLVLALGVVMFITFTSTQLPEWIEDREQNHGLSVKEQLGIFQSDLLQISNEDLGRVLSTDISLAPEPIAFLQRGETSGQVSVLDQTAMDLSMAGASLVANGDALATDADGALGTWNNVDTLQALVLRMDVATAIDAETGIDVTFDDGTTQIQATFAHVGPDAPGSPCAGYSLVVRLTLPARNLPQTCGVTDAGTFDTDLFDALPLQQALGNLQRPFSVSFSVSAVAGTGAALWLDNNGIPNSVGTPIPGTYDVQRTLGSVAYLPNYLQAVREDVRLDGGSLTVEQATGAAMVSAGVQVTSDGTNGLLTATFVDFTGTGSIAGDGTATVRVTPTAILDSLYQANSVQLLMTGNEAWEKHFQDERYLSALAPQVGAQNPLVLDASLNWWVQLRIIEAKVDLK
ncbi:MAG: hypothetical protein ACPHK8_03760 [Thermoplasmatota archaeon]